MRLYGIVTQTHLLILFVVGVAALKPEYLAIAFVSQDMRADTIQEPTVVADHYSATGKVLQTFLQRTQGIHVDIIGRLVQQQYVGLRFECQGQVQTVSLTTRQHAAFLLLVRTGEVETT